VTGTLVDRRRDVPVAGRIARAAGPLGRTVGLLGRSELSDGEGMWFDGCNAIHTFGMRMTIDVVFLDASGTVVKVAANLPPWRMASAHGGRTVIELGAGACARAGIEPGSQLEIRWHSPT
jgi:uncharacterized protein